MMIPAHIPIELLEVPVRLIDVLVKHGFCDSNSQAKNLIKQNGITIDGFKITDTNTTIETLPPQGIVIARSRRKLICFQAPMGNPLWDTKEANGEFAVDNLVNSIKGD